jgi:hypothetical protein
MPDAESEMSDVDTTGPLGAPGAGSRKDQAKQMVGQAGQALKAEAQSFASVAQDRVRAEAEKGTQAATRTLGDFANAVRRAGDELGGADQSPASRLVQQAADGLESLSRNLADKDPGDLQNAVRDFGRRNPVAFIGGAVLVGLALGRFARASEPNSSQGFSDEAMTFAQEDEYDGPAEAGSMAAGIDTPITDSLGDLAASNATTTASPVGVDDGASGVGAGGSSMGATDPDGATELGDVDTTSPHSGGR